MASGATAAASMAPAANFALVMAPVAMAAAARLQISPLLMALMVGHGAIASTVSPLTAAGATANNILESMQLAGHRAEVFGYNAAANALAAAVGPLPEASAKADAGTK